ncbi:MAG: hypothetical protein JWM80_504 [Cyanobacteria bacterium RYN_339]|nr:hypothetical protein [Cyanobacteria bacterium RYN_339]
MKLQNSIVKLTLVAAVAFALTGCGNRSIAAAPVDESLAASSATAPALPVAAPLAAAPMAAGASQMAAAGPAPTLVDLEATVSTKKNGSFLGMGAFKCTVTVNNSSSVVRTGTLTVTFMNGTKPSSTAPVVKQVTIPAGGSQSFDLSDPKWTTSDVKADITTTPVQAAASAMPMAQQQMAMPMAGGY